jgi:RNA polymerase sigma factor (TIGR02999 family)
MPTPDATSITDLLAAAKGGDADAQEAAARMVYAELHAIADGYLRRERTDHTLQPTALVNEAYLRLLGQDAPWQNRTQFYGIAAQMMRRILVDHARRTTAARRDRGLVVALDDDLATPDAAAPDAALDVLEVHQALDQLEALDPRQARIVELKFFVGFSLDEIAEVLGISAATVSREWAMARAWLQAQLRDD